MQIVIPVPGIGTRILEGGYTGLKSMMDLFPGETNFHFLCNDACLATTRMSEILLENVPTAIIHTVSSLNWNGSMDSVLQMADQLPDDEEIILSYCEYGSKWPYQDFLEEMHRKHVDGGVVAYVGVGSDKYGCIHHYDQWVTRIREPNSCMNHKMDVYTSNGIYYFRSGALLKQYCKQIVDANLMHGNGNPHVSLVLDSMCQARLNVRLFEIEMNNQCESAN